MTSREQHFPDRSICRLTETATAGPRPEQAHARQNHSMREEERAQSPTPRQEAMEARHR